MKAYKKPEAEIMFFESEDIITLSTASDDFDFESELGEDPGDYGL